jgi:argininosuccinate lyase
MAHNSKKPLHKLDIQEIAQIVGDNKINPQMLKEIIRNTTIQSSLNERKSFGSSGYEEQKRMINERIKKIDSYRTIATKQQNEISKAFDALSNKVKEFTK